jgi:hypothetical protein
MNSSDFCIITEWVVCLLSIRSKEVVSYSECADYPPEYSRTMIETKKLMIVYSFPHPSLNKIIQDSSYLSIIMIVVAGIKKKA